MTPPTMSIVIPAKDEASYLGDTLTHLLEARAASAHEIEIVVVVAPSTDATATIATRADLVVHEDGTRRSIAHARNLGATAATGRILFHTDADCRIDDLDQLLTAASERLSDGYAAVTGRIAPLPGPRPRTDRAFHAFANGLIRRSQRSSWALARGECVIVDRDAFAAVGGFREEIALGEDCELFRRLHAAGFRTAYDERIVVGHSTRRFDADGYLRTMGVFAREGLWQALFDRGYLEVWKGVR